APGPVEEKSHSCCGGPVQPGQNDTYSRATSGDSPQTWDNVTCLRRIRTWDANGRTRGGGGGRPRGCTAASSTGSCGPADPESCAGRRRLRADAWRRRAAADADERTRGAASTCRAGAHGSKGTARSPARSRALAEPDEDSGRAP